MSAESTRGNARCQRVSLRNAAEYDRDMIRDLPAVVLGTNVFVAVLFKPKSDSARIHSAVRQGSLRMLWNDATRRDVRPARLWRRSRPCHGARSSTCSGTRTAMLSRPTRSASPRSRIRRIGSLRPSPMRPARSSSAKTTISSRTLTESTFSCSHRASIYRNNGGAVTDGFLQKHARRGLLLGPYTVAFCRRRSRDGGSRGCGSTPDSTNKGM